MPNSKNSHRTPIVMEKQKPPGQERRGQMEGDPVIVVQQHHHGEAYRRGQEAVDGVEHGVPSGDHHIKGVDLTQNSAAKMKQKMVISRGGGSSIRSFTWIQLGT